MKEPEYIPECPASHFGLSGNQWDPELPRYCGDCGKGYPKVKPAIKEIENSVQGIKDYLAAKEVNDKEATPEGMEFLGWVLDGFLLNYPPISGLARPVYAFIELDA